ncbi:drug resistance transporter, EmrB/QacA subfamily [Seinonella peptonophila]|uniref:Drug resistance transporter, EmrB/QacA subfamily n=1 Tax=Seinonella peptonophila TaxID=112248 RepID=A0A1M4U2B4_9BACL|nr:MFS transporter [Seinonella peptonophila]SHE50697.1 drug resistance transporter, EmrB/QacA subfamily [Seinonella peptonophila]
MNTNTVAIPNPKRWMALFLLAAAQFFVILDTSIIGVALPSIKEALGYSQSNLQWIFNAYVVVFGGLLLLGGKLSDLFGQRRIFSLGFLILTLASLFAGLAWSEASMNIGRALQGLGAALIAPSALTIVMQLFSNQPAELNKAMGIWGASAAAGGSAGVFLGGIITEWLDWSWVFLINVPVGVIILFLVPKLLQKGSRGSGKVDFLGAFTVTASIITAVLAIVRAEFNGWMSGQTIGLLAASVVLFGLFLLIQKVKKEPLVPLHIFKAPNLVAGNIVNALLAATWIPLWYFLNLYLQQILHYSSFAGGIALLPMTVLIMILMTTFTGKLIGKFGFKGPFIVGMLLLGVSLLLFSNTPLNGSFAIYVLPASIIAALAMAFAYIPATMASMSGVKPEESGLASGIVNTTYQVGSAIGLAIMVAISGATTSSKLAKGVEQIIALNEGFHHAFIGAGIVAFLAAVLALILLKVPKKN